MPSPPRDPVAAAGSPPDARRLPADADSPALTAVREAWTTARRARDEQHPALRRALAAFARDGRARGIPVAALLQALDTLVRPGQGGDPTLDFQRVREAAGTAVIRAYYQAD